MTNPIAGLGIVIGLLFAALPSTSYAAADPIPARPPSPLAGLPTEVPNGQVVALADGDRYEVTSARQGQTIRGRRWDSATGTWGLRTVIFKEKDRRCWGVRARGAGNGVAVRVGCGPAFVEDWDGHPYAIVSADTETWQSRRLPGYAWGTPGVSPDGTRAVWARDDDYYTWTAAAGFVRRVTSPPAGAFEDDAPMITDDGSVTIAYTTQACAVTFDRHPATGATVRQVLPIDPGCNATSVTSIDATTLAVGDPADEWTNSRLTRADESAPWVVGTIAPLSAPELLPDEFSPDSAPLLLAAPGRPLAVVTNGGDDLRVQLYDPALQTWQEPITMLTRSGGTRCNYVNDRTRALGFHALSLRCAGPDRFVTSTDGVTWTALPTRARTVGPNRSLGLVAVPDREQTAVVGADAVTIVPLGVDGRCDVVVPIAADKLLRLTSSRGRDGWPDLLQRSTAQGWKTVHRIETPSRGECRGVLGAFGAAPRFSFNSRDGSMGVRFVEVDGRWDVKVQAYPR